MKHCSTCGATVTPGASDCARCGATRNSEGAFTPRVEGIAICEINQSSSQWSPAPKIILGTALFALAILHIYFAYLMEVSPLSSHRPHSDNLGNAFVLATVLVTPIFFLFTSLLPKPPSYVAHVVTLLTVLITGYFSYGYLLSPGGQANLFVMINLAIFCIAALVACFFAYL